MYFIIGVVVKALSTVVTYSSQVIQSRLKAGYAKAEKSKSVLQNVICLYRELNRFSSLYKGWKQNSFKQFSHLPSCLSSMRRLLPLYSELCALFFSFEAMTDICVWKAVCQGQLIGDLTAFHARN